LPPAAGSWPSAGWPSGSQAPRTSATPPMAGRPDSEPGCYDSAPADAR